MILEKELIILKNKVKKLEKKDIDLIISDFDDTIFCSKELIEKDHRKWRRWKEWNEFIIKNDLVDFIIDDIYKNKEYPKTISSKLRKNHDLILTAWLEAFQLPKIKVTDLEHINVRVVLDAEDKIIETIKYIIEYLKFIPNKITVYEDRPKYFIEYKDFIEDFLWTELEIMLVEMKDNISEPKIKKV